jgi:hypothetical protein
MVAVAEQLAILAEPVEVALGLVRQVLLQQQGLLVPQAPVVVVVVVIQLVVELVDLEQLL